MERKKLGDLVETALTDNSLQDTAASLAEAALDAALEDGLLRDIPIIGSVLGIGRAAITISDRLFLKKLSHFLNESSSISLKQRTKFIEEISESNESPVKIGEKILYLIDKCEDHESARLAGIIFSAFLDKKISRKQFITMSSALSKISYFNLIDFLKDDRERIPAWEANHFLSAGLVEFCELEISVEDQWDHDATNPYVVSGASLDTSPSDIGIIMKEILRNRIDR